MTKKREDKRAVDRRTFLKNTMAATAAAVGSVYGPLPEIVSAQQLQALGGKGGVTSIPSQCPYCGVGCASMIQVENGRIVGIVPDKDSPVNKGNQCIKGLNSHEPIYKDRLTDVLIRKDMNDPMTGHESKTKGRFDDDVWRKASWEEAEELVTEKVAALIEKHGGNSIGLIGSGQLTMEAQWLENKLLKGVIQSNSIEANARSCMTSAVTGYFKTLGSDTPPLSYEDAEMADFITFWGHNPRASHSILFWRVADYKKKAGIPTLVSDPRRTGTVEGLEDINPRNSYHIQTINGDISMLNAIAHEIIVNHPDAVDREFLEKNVNGHKEYIEGIKARYSPDQVVEKLKVIDGDRIDVDTIKEVARVWAEASIKGREAGRGGVISFWGIGYNQHIHGQHNVISVINLHLLTGNIRRPGAGPFSMTGQPNAMSERLMGGLTGRLPFNKGINDDAHRAWMNTCWRLPEKRLDVTAKLKNPGFEHGMIERALRGGPDALRAIFWAYTTHIHLADVHTLVRPALHKMFVVVQDIYRHAPNLLYADVVFPAATWGEWQGGVYINSERRLYVCDGTANPPKNCRPDLDMAIDKGKLIAKKLGLDADRIFPYKKRSDGFYDSEEVFREIIKASKGTDADLTGMLEVEEKTGKSPYQQLRDLKGIQWPAPTAEIAQAGGLKRRYMGQEEGWKKKPYGMFRTKDGKANMKLCEQDYSQMKEVCGQLMEFGVKKDYFLIDHPEILVKARDMGLTPELPDLEYADAKPGDIPKDKYPFWLGLGVVYEHFHTAKTVRSATNRKLVPEQYVEMNDEDAERYGLRDGDKVWVITRRSRYQARVSIGTDSRVRPARNTVPKGYLFSPWNLSVADSADPRKNKWLVNAVSHRAWDPVSGQVDYKKLAARIEKV